MPFLMPYRKIHDVKLRLDKSGRMVLPKKLRQRLGVRAGSTFEASEAAEGILLRPIQKRPSVVERHRFLVHVGQATHSFNWRELFDDVEQERLRDILGG